MRDYVSETCNRNVVMMVFASILVLREDIVIKIRIGDALELKEEQCEVMTRTLKDA